MGSGAFLKVIAQNFDVLAGPVITLVYPLYASVKAIETKSPVDDQQWLTYWVLYSFITLFELTFSRVLEWIPIWSYVKLIFSCWLVLPYFNGAAYVYEHFVRPVLVNPQTANFWPIARKNIFSKPDDILSAAERYMQENGTEAFERLISKATAPVLGCISQSALGFSIMSERSSKSAGNKRTILEEVQAEREYNPWSNSSIFDEDYRY